MGINRCEIHQDDFNPIILEKSGNENSKISITSLVKISNNRINLAITEAKLKAKRNLIRFLKKGNFDDPKPLRFSNNSFNYNLKGALVTRICIQNNQFIKLTIEINNNSIINAKKIRQLFYE